MVNDEVDNIFTPGKALSGLIAHEEDTIMV
jgi:hypothetical protein